jgi:dolichyl-diphosphooligosaccharide---protein glycosyltransferase
MVALHCAAIVLLDWAQNKYDPTLAKAYSLFYVIGTAIALCVPPVGYAPFKSLEQIFALLVFIFINVLHVSEAARKKADVEILSQATFRIRVKYVSVTCGALFVFAFAIAPSGFFGPLSSRVRGLFLQHTRTGNPLVDSVAEHQPANADAYWHYLHIAFNGWMIGLFMLPYAIYTGKNSRAVTFLFCYGIVAYYFSLKMARLILLSGPVAAALSAIILAFIVEWAVAQFIWSEADEEEEQLALQGKDSQTRKAAVKKSSNENDFENSIKKIKMAFKGYKHMRLGLAALVLLLIVSGALSGPFERHSENMAHSFSNPQLMFKSRLNNGNVVMIDDYREAYFWLRDKTPEDSRVMAWWDYGYQITGIGNRTSIADGNTWNHEHIATLGKCLTSPVKEAHGLIRHLADYVLIWSGGGGDDLAKSPHMARIGNSVYRDICPKDPLCQHFGFQGPNHENPTPMMKKSLLYNLHAHNMKPNVHVDPTMFQDVFSSKYGLVRIFKVMNVSQESKDWLANPANRVCDAPGSWYCNGQYPPAPEIQELLAKRRDFGQLEDFNRKNRDDDYHRAYMQRMGGGAH